MSNDTTQSKKCTESNEQSDEPTVHELGKVRHVSAEETERIRIHGTSGSAAFGFRMPEEARAVAEALLPDGYEVVREDGSDRGVITR